MSKNLAGNMIAGAVEQVLTGFGFFLIYGVLYRETGAEQVGVLSLVLVLSSIGSMAGAGFSSALSHFVPLFESRDERENTVLCIDTTIICTAALYLAVLLATYVPFVEIVSRQSGAEYVDLVYRMAPLAIGYTLLLGVGSASTLILTALLRNDLRLCSTGFGQAVGLAVVFMAVPDYGIVGGLWAMIAQAGTTTVIAWLLLMRVIPELGPIPFRFRKTMAQMVFGLGSNVQVQTLLVAAIEPSTRLLIGSFGSLSAVAYFSLASRFVLQLRALIYAGAQPLLSALSHARGDSAATGRLYQAAERTIAVTSVIVFSATVAAAPFVEEVWMGEREGTFVLFVAILAAGWFANSLTLPAYFNAYSLGRMNHCLIGHAILCGTNLLLGALLAKLLGSVGAVLGMGGALVISAAYLAIANGRFAPTGVERMLGWKDTATAISALLAIAICVLAYPYLRLIGPVLLAGVLSGLIWAVVMLPSLAANPEARMVMGQICAKLRRQK